MIFVDIDDTLIKWGTQNDEWEWDDKLIEAITHYVFQRPILGRSEPTLLWSGGGRDYASTFAHRLDYTGWGFKVHDVIALDPTIPLAGDICIDDMAEARSHGKCGYHWVSTTMSIEGVNCPLTYSQHSEGKGHEWRGWTSPATWLTPEQFIEQHGRPGTPKG